MHDLGLALSVEPGSSPSRSIGPRSIQSVGQHVLDTSGISESVLETP